MSHEWDDESIGSFDEDEVNARVHPDWHKYRDLIERRRLYHLDTCRDVKEYYEKYCTDLRKDGSGYLRACNVSDDNALCKDAGLPDNLFRGSRVSDGLKIIFKAVHLRSREYDIVHFLSTPPQRSHPMNHSIPVVDMIPVPEDEIGFIVMEEWSPQLLTELPCCMRMFLGALQQCVDHTVFMHQHHIAHLDISMRNILFDGRERYAFIDYECSRRFDVLLPTPRIQGHRTTEVPPECERGEATDPYKADIWALAVLILRSCQLTGFHIPELLRLTKPMLYEDPDRRPSAKMVQKAFDSMIPTIDETRLQQCHTVDHLRDGGSFPPIPNL